MNSEAQSPTPEQHESRRQGSNTWARLCIFMAFAIVFSAIAAKFVPAGADVEKSVGLITTIALRAGFAGWAICWIIPGKWLNLKTTALIALVLYVSLGLWLWHITP